MYQKIDINYLYCQMSTFQKLEAVKDWAKLQIVNEIIDAVVGEGRRRITCLRMRTTTSSTKQAKQKNSSTRLQLQL